MNEHDLKITIEATLLAAGRPVTTQQLLDLFDERERPSKEQLLAALEQLGNDYAERGIEVIEVASGWRIQVRPRCIEVVSRLWQERPSKYSRALLETLALVAYRQPITRSEIEEIRGVSISSTIMRTLQERNWIRVVGHREVPGRPELLGTTREFLDYFGLKSLDQLPTLAELRDVETIGVQLELPSGEATDSADGEAAAGEQAEDASAAAASDEPATDAAEGEDAASDEQAQDAVAQSDESGAEVANETVDADASNESEATDQLSEASAEDAQAEPVSEDESTEEAIESDETVVTDEVDDTEVDAEEDEVEEIIDEAAESDAEVDAEDEAASDANEDPELSADAEEDDEDVTPTLVASSEDDEGATRRVDEPPRED